MKSYIVGQAWVYFPLFKTTQMVATAGLKSKYFIRQKAAANV